MAEADNHVEPENNPLAGIDERLSVLKAFESDLVNTQTANARIILTPVLEGDLEWLDAQRMVGVCYGSVQYNDPKNLDCDIAYITDTPDLDYLDEEFHQHLDALKTVLGPQWPGPRFELDASVINLPEIRRIIAEYQSDPGRMEERDILLIKKLDTVLSGLLIVPSQAPLLEEYRMATRELLTGVDWLQKMTEEELDEVIFDRKLRRGLVSE